MRYIVSIYMEGFKNVKHKVFKSIPSVDYYENGGYFVINSSAMDDPSCVVMANGLAYISVDVEYCFNKEKDTNDYVRHDIAGLPEAGAYKD